MNPLKLTVSGTSPTEISVSAQAVADVIATIASGHDPAYYTQAAKGSEYYSSAAGKSGMEPEGTWTGAGCPELGLAIGAAVNP